MRVNIQFSAEADDVPSHVIRLLVDADNIIEDSFTTKLSHELENLIKNKNFVDSISFLASVRDKLMAIDHRLDDCMRILVGYQQFIANPQTPAADSAILQQPLDTSAVDKVIKDAKEYTSVVSEGGFE